MSATATVWTAEMLHRLHDDGRRRELIRGELIEMSPGNPTHGRVIALLGAGVVNHVYGRDLGDVFMGDTGWHLEHGEDTVLAPDIAFVRKARLAEVNAVGFGKTFPDLAVEVLSPSNTAAEMLLKIEIYLACGVSAVWIVDPVRERAEVHRPGEPVVRLGLGDALEDARLLPGLRLPLRGLFRRD